MAWRPSAQLAARLCKSCTSDRHGLSDTRSWTWLGRLSLALTLLQGACTPGFSEDELSGGEETSSPSAEQRLCKSYWDQLAADQPLLHHSLGSAASDAQQTISAGLGCSFDEGVQFDVASDPTTCIGAHAVFLGKLGGTSTPRTFGCAGTPLDFAGTPAFTLEVWVELMEPLFDYPRVISREWKSEAGREGYDILIAEGQGGGLQLERWADDRSDGAYGSSNQLRQPGFHHLVGTFDGTDAALYVDGEELDKRASTTQVKADPGALFMLGGEASSGKTQNGLPAKYDELAVYDRALSAERIKIHYEAGRPD